MNIRTRIRKLIAEAVRRDVHNLIPKHITKEDILASINYNMHLEYGIGNSG
jgi:DNA-directed RNA polymerase subunit beta